jgi:hypothetical protein
MRQTNDIQAAVEAFGWIGWTLAHNQYDNYPKSFAGDWDDMISFIDKHRAPRKGLHGLAGLFANDGRRCLANALPRQFLPFDLDGENGVGVPDDVLASEISSFRGIQTIAYETASSKPGARKARFITKLSRGVTDTESRALGLFMGNLTGVPDYCWDKSVYMLSQICYLPPVGSEIIRIDGEPLDVDAMLARIPKPKPRKRVSHPRRLRAAADLRSFFEQNGLILRDKGATVHVRCPWVHEHTNGDEGGTAYFEPSPENGFVGGFKCLHAHCEHRTIKDIHLLAKGAAA